MAPQDQQRPVGVKFPNIRRWLGEVQLVHRPAVGGPRAHNGRMKSTLLKPSPLKSIEEDAPWDADVTVKTYVNSVNCDPLFKCIEGYQSFSDLTMDWWTGRLETKKFVEITAKTLALKPSLLQDLNLLLGLDKCHASRLFISPNETEVSAVVLEESNGGQILPVSTTAKSLPPIITSTKDVQDILASDDPWKTLVDVDPLWVPSVMQLFQIELETATDSDYSRKCMKYLRSLVKKYHKLPPSFLLNNISREGTHPVRGGGFADIWKGWIGTQSVCLKVLRIFTETEDNEKLVHAFCHEALVWKQCQHPNVLPFLGVSTQLFAPSFCLISPWFNNGDVMTFLKKNPKHNRLTVFLEIAEGVNYLHSYNPPIIHGDIRGANILVADDFRCVLSDFGLAVVTETHGLTPTTGALRGSTRWLAPEIISPAQFPKCPKSARDIYAFGCTMLEIITGQPPFSEHKMDVAVIHNVMNGLRPSRPSAAAKDIWCPDKIWDLIESCWAEDGHSRPPACSLPRFLKGVARDLAAVLTTNPAASTAAVLLRLTPRRQLKPKRSVFSLSHSSYDGGSEYTTSSTSSWSTDNLESLLGSPPNSLPSSIRAKRTEKAVVPPLIVFSPPSDESGTDHDVKKITIVLEENRTNMTYTFNDLHRDGSIHQAVNMMTGEAVAVKELYLGRLSVANSIRLMKEIRFLAQLSHPNIDRYYGLTREDDAVFVVLECGGRYSLHQLLQDSGPVVHDFASSYIYQALQGLTFLHAASTIHFNIRATNILLISNGRGTYYQVKLTNFGIPFDWLPQRNDLDTRRITKVNWMAPEVIKLQEPSQKSDIWALGCTLIEMLTGRPPYDALAHDSLVMYHILEDSLPPIPPEYRGSGQLPDFLRCCFQRNPSKRPGADDLLNHPWMKAGYLVYSLHRQSTVTGRIGRRLSLVVGTSELEAEVSIQDMGSLWDGRLGSDGGDRHEFVKTTFSRRE